MAVAGLPCFPLSAAAAAPAVRLAARPNRQRPPRRWTGAAPSADRGEMGNDDGGGEALPPGRSVVVTTTKPAAAELSVKGMYIRIRSRRSSS
jgi:hypothetical protein